MDDFPKEENMEELALMRLAFKDAPPNEIKLN